ncbi:MAG: hypothetical protein ABIP94_24445 [Planctomycetota bacterium]
MNGFDGLVLLAYVSLAVELLAFPMPSEASTWQLFAMTGGQGSGALANARRRSRLQKVVLHLLPTAMGVALFSIPLLCIAWPPARSALSTWSSTGMTCIGLLLVVAGRFVTFASVLQLRAQRAAGGGPAHGLFRWSRNPGLCGMFTFYIGLCLAFGAPLMWLGLPLYIGNMHLRVCMEEADLLARHGEAWRAYVQRVPRYLGRRRLGSGT